VGEGAETEAQDEFLRAEGCDLLQGYHLARPMSGDARRVAPAATASSTLSLESDRGVVAPARQMLDQLMPHIERGLEIALRLERLDAAHRAIQAALDELTVGIALLDEAGRVLHMNRTLARHVEERDGLSVAPDGLRAASPSTMAALRSLVVRAIDEYAPSSGAVSIERAAKHRPLHVIVAPIRPTAGERAGGLARALVLVADPELHTVVPAELLRATYGLTDAEARVARRLRRGKALEEVADELGISVSTVRNHLKQVFEKTGTYRQAELVHLLHGGSLPLREEG
jgi:DNA-binding CsgD family transcriptional regulator